MKHTKTKVTVKTRERVLTQRHAKRVRLTEAEEKVLRMKTGLHAEDDASLEAKTSNPELLQQLRDIEAQLFLQAGLIEQVSKKQQIIDKLKRR